MQVPLSFLFNPVIPPCHLTKRNEFSVGVNTAKTNFSLDCFDEIAF
jgi:hypothetical protein